MKWFFALNKSSVPSAYADMARVAVHTAQMRSSLEPHMLWDGPEHDPLLDWMRQRGVTIHGVQTRLYEDLARITQERKQPHLLTISAGTFLRTELPALGQSLGFGDETILYTDCDVLFLEDPIPTLSRLTPRLLAIAPEFDPSNFIAANAGVMLMNLPTLAARDQDFFRFTRRNLKLFMNQAFDQGAYLCYYNSPHRWLTALGVPQRLFLHRMRVAPRFARPQWDRLPLGLNWKPYWGAPPPDAAILHFHGPKPTDRTRILSGNVPALYKKLVTDEYWRQCGEWDHVMQEITDSF